jgi:multimeric flavodoxin WrbA
MSEPRYDDLKALFINCTLKRSPEPSNTAGLVEVSTCIMEKHGVQVEVLRAIDHDIAIGVWPDMTEHGWATDAWPEIYQKVLAADILVIAGPIWLGDNSSVTKQIIERLYACSHLLNDAGQYVYYGRVAGCLITGNEDGVKHCAINALYSLHTSATPFPHRPTRAGSARPVRVRPTWTPDRAVRRTSSPTGTPPS